ncbi:hypothetical protein [Tissierella sp. Yu-01]|uniref:hypothetical protein n=1 Tax=Tissierella sp. Yu-01 TaxID=3035694 RepID=UPI00240DB55E|nr:hypothetical protein [Tissierella sp. Yu-01]WFA07812.1 hypothetical protein P3962_08710 [Tissierella sp. Yu-01]
MDKGYQKIFWGIFLATFNITLGGFIKIVPAFVGWIVVVSGIGILKANFQDESFEKGERYTGCLILLSFLGTSFLGLFFEPRLNSSIIFSYYPVILYIFELLMIYEILNGTINLLESKVPKDISTTINSKQIIYKQKTYVILQIISTIGFIITLTTYSELLMTISALFAIIIRIYVMSIISGLKKFFLNFDSGQSNDIQPPL